jgi:hypothetical protein
MTNYIDSTSQKRGCYLSLSVTNKSSESKFFGCKQIWMGPLEHISKAWRNDANANKHWHDSQQ